MSLNGSISSLCTRPSRWLLATTGEHIKSLSAFLLWVSIFRSFTQLLHLLIFPLLGQLNQEELSARIDDFLITPAGEIEHLHNQLIAGIYGNVTREMPDQGVASWVSANDKPTTGAGSKPVSGDAAEQRLKTEVMQLPSRDRRRLKDLSQNEVRNLFLE